MKWATLAVDGSMAFHDGIPELEDLQQAVGGYVEAVDFHIAGSAATLWINEEGKLVSDPERNFKAELICPLAGDWIAGDVAFTGGVGPEGETLGLTTSQVAELRHIDRDVCVILIDEGSAKGAATR
ncbi:MAG: DUF3846 domain-containing protein [Candidatus Limnocylindrales bacterium]|jgi:hypothetical protein